jgi:hypothetical protein
MPRIRASAPDVKDAALRPRQCPVSGSRLCENSDVELARRKFVSITLNKKRTALAVTVERRKGRKQFCAFSARVRFHTAWVIRYRVEPTAGQAIVRGAPKAEVPEHHGSSRP